MTEEELISRCRALQSVGDSQAEATLRLAKELQELRAKFYGIHQERSPADAALISNAVYCLTNIAGMVKLAGQFGILSKEETAPEAPPKEYPEAAAVAATRKANGLPPAMDAAVLQSSMEKPAGHYDKTPKMSDKEGSD